MLLLILIALASLFNDQASVTPRRIEKTHGRGEDRYTVVMIRPIVTGLPQPVLKRIRKELELKRVLRGHYHFYKNRYMSDFDYRVTYNQNHILAIAFSWNAYFAAHERTLAFDLRDGSLIEAEDLFREDQVPELVKLIDQKLRNEVEQRIRDYKGTRDMRAMLATQGQMTVTPDDLYNFAIDDKGITFFYDPGFHHAADWLEPEGRYFFKYSEIKNLLKPNTVVSQFVK